MKIKVLLPSLKEKKRYVLFRIFYLDSKAKFNVEDFLSFLKNFFGEILYAKAGIFPIRELTSSDYFILRVKHKYKDLLISSTLFYTNKALIIVPVKTFGTLRKLKEFIRKNI